jgi:hypothetical protein
MNEQLIVAFDECLIKLERGADLETCLKSYPDLAAELRPMLEAAIQTTVLMSSVLVPAGSQESSRRRFLDRAVILRSKLNGRASALRTTTPGSPTRPGSHALGWLGAILRPVARHAYVAATILILLFLLVGAGAMRASAHSLPGTPLYDLKLTLEQTQIDLSRSPESRARLESEFNERRIDETRQVTERRWNVALAFGGLLDAINGEDWSVAGRKVIVPAGISLEGNPQIGLYVWVTGIAQSDGSVLARQIQVRGERFQGQVESIQSGVWQVGGQQVFTSDHTEIEGDPGTGDSVEVNAMILPGGSLLAEQIRLVEHAPQGEEDEQLNATVEAGEDHNPLQTESADLRGDDHGGDDSRTLEPNNPTSSGNESGASSIEDLHGDGGKTLESSPTLEPSDTPEPSNTPVPTRTIAPTKTAEPSRTSEPTRTSEPAKVSDPTRTREPSKTPEPSRTPKPDDSG